MKDMTIFKQYRRKPIRVKEGIFHVSHASEYKDEERFIREEMEYKGWDEVIRIRIGEDFDSYLWRIFLPKRKEGD